jgi:hypothetical protein
MTIGAVASKRDDGGEEWLVYRHHDQTAELWYRVTPGTAAQLLMGRAPMYQIRAFLTASGIGEDGWSPA